MLQTKKTILVVDDEETVALLFTEILKTAGYSVVSANDGQSAWEIYQEKKPDAIFCDLLMPRMDGLTLLAKIRSDNPFVPFVVVSGKSDLQDAVEAMRNGAWDFLPKPLESPSQIETTLHRVWERVSFLKMRRDYQEELEAEVISRTAELQHRVKNNLQIILILLDLQRENTPNFEARELLWESQNRIHAMAQIQDQAFDGEKGGILELRTFLSGLIFHLSAGLGWESRLLTAWEMEPQDVSAGQAFSLGLILNEIVTAILELDMPPPELGTLTITMAHVDDGYRLQLSDDWGALQTWNPGPGSLSMSATMLKILVELADGRLDYGPQNPHTISIHFKSPPSPPPLRSRG